MNNHENTLHERNAAALAKIMECRGPKRLAKSPDLETKLAALLRETDDKLKRAEEAMRKSIRKSEENGCGEWKQCKILRAALNPDERK